MAAFLLLRPGLAILFSTVVVAIVLCARSPAYPLAFAGLPPVIFALVGPSPLPRGSVTVIIAGCVMLAVLLSLTRPDPPPARVLLGAATLLTFALLVLMYVRLPASSGTEFGVQKTGLFLVSNLPFVIGGIAVGWSLREVRLLLVLLLGVTVAESLVLIFELSSGAGNTALPSRYALSGDEDPIGLGRAAGAGLIVAIGLILARSSQATRLLAVGAVPALTLAVFASGSRGPLLATAFALLVLIGLVYRDTASRGRILPVALVLLVALAVVPLLIPQSTISRSFSFLTSDVGVSSNGRTWMWSTSYDLFRTYPFEGIGTGQFAALSSIQLYPHNIFLEAASELGIVALLIVVTLIARAGGQLWGAWRDARGDARVLLAIVLALFVAALTNAMFSGAFHNNRVLWLWIGVAAGLAARARRTPPSATPAA